MDVTVEQKRLDVEQDEDSGQEPDEAVHIRHGELRPARETRAAREEDAEQDAAREQRVGDDARGPGGVPVDPARDV